MNNSTFKTGVIFTAGPFVIWGVSPLFWKLLADMDSVHILGYRIISSLCFTGIILAINRDFKWLAIFRDFKEGALILLSALVLCINWGVYVWAINQGYTIEVSLGYYINPLVSIVLGLIFLREKLNPLQWLAFGMACLGVLTLTILSGRLPWISLIIAFTFGIYGLLKKKVALSSLESLGAETLAALPIGIALLFLPQGISSQGLSEPAAGLQFAAGFQTPGLRLVMLVMIGVITATPLYFFGRGAKLLPLSTVGFIQFLGPTIQFILGYFVFGEYFPGRYFIAFAFIWLSWVVYIVSLNYKRFVKR